MFPKKSTLPAFLLGALVGAAVVEAGVCMIDPCTRRVIMRKGKRMVRLARNIGQKFM